MALRSRIFGAGKALILIAALVATYIVFAVGSLQYALRSQEVQVPDLTNRSTADASAIISAAPADGARVVERGHPRRSGSRRRRRKSARRRSEALAGRHRGRHRF